ncbi:MAG: hypothetical protein M3275_00625 [Thermoproteota archaeon]|nr:hypothetical protein [Thermoproteota archaeon]
MLDKAICLMEVLVTFSRKERNIAPISASEFTELILSDKRAELKFFILANLTSKPISPAT